MAYVRKSGKQQKAELRSSWTVTEAGKQPISWAGYQVALRARAESKRLAEIDRAKLVEARLKVNELMRKAKKELEAKS